MNVKIRQIVLDVRRKLKSVSRELVARGISRNRLWTVAILKALGELGESKGFKVLPKFDSSDKRIASEWLYDLIWYDDDESGLKRVGLVLESEWAYSEWDVISDFQKLLVAKAAVKVFVAENYPQTLAKCIANIRSFEPKDDASIYLFALYGRDQFRFEVYNEKGETVNGSR